MAKALKQEQYLIAVDAGNGGVNAVISLGDGKSKSYYTPSYRALTDGRTLSSQGGLQTMKYEYVIWKDQKYVMGNDAMRLNSDGVEVHQGDARYGNDLHSMLIAYAIAKLGVAAGSIALCIFLPPGIYNDAAGVVRKAFMGQSVTIQLSTDKEPRQWTYDSVTILPEGTGAALCLGVDELGNPRQHPLLDGRVIFFDGGMKTFDALEITNGEINPKNLISATYKTEGIYRHIIQPILSHYKHKYPYLSIGHIDAAIRNGIGGAGYILDPDNARIDIEGAVKSAARAYADYVANAIIDTNYESFVAFRGAYFYGGLANFSPFMDAMLEFYPEKVIDLKKVSELKKINPVDMNAVAGLRFLLAKQKTVGAKK